MTPAVLSGVGAVRSVGAPAPAPVSMGSPPTRDRIAGDADSWVT